MNIPVITAIIPCHNHEQWVTDALESLTLDEYPLRIVFVDDGSTDHSWEKVCDYCTHLNKVQTSNTDEPLELVTGQFCERPIIAARFSKSYGPASARNYGLKVGWEGTDIFAFLDSDDFYVKGKIQRSLEYFQNPFIYMVSSDYSTLNIHDGLKQRQYKKAYSKNLLLQECIINSDSLISKKAFEEAGLFDEQLRVAEDWDMWMRISEHGIIAHIPEDLLTIRVGRHSSSSVISKEQWNQNYQRVFQKLQARQNR